MDQYVDQYRVTMFCVVGNEPENGHLVFQGLIIMALFFVDCVSDGVFGYCSY